MRMLDRCGARAIAQLAATASVLCAAAAFAQSVQTQPPVFRADIDLFLIEARVTDAGGATVTGLGAGDFRVRIDGRARRVITAEFIDFKKPGAVPVVAARTYSTNTAGEAARTMLFAIDTESLPPVAGLALRRALDRFVERLTDADRVGLVAVPTGSPQLAPTSDRGALRAALRSLVGSRQVPFGQYQITNGEAVAIEHRDNDAFQQVAQRECMFVKDPGAIIQCPERVKQQAIMQARIVRERTMARLRALASALDALPPDADTTNVVFVSTGLIDYKDYQRLYTDVARTAASRRATVTVMQMDAIGGDAEDALAPTGPDLRLLRTGLSNLAGAAGAEMILAVTPEAGLEDLGRDAGPHYLLGVETQRGDRNGVPHRIEIEAAGSGVRVRHRRHFLAVEAQRPRDARQHIEGLLTASGVARGIPLAVQTATIRGSDATRLQVSIVTRVGRPLSGRATVGILVRNGDIVAASSLERLEPVADGEAPFNHVSSVLVPPGRYQLRLAIADERGLAGSVDHSLVVDLPPAGAVRTSDLLVGQAEGSRIRPALDVNRHRPIAAIVELYAEAAGGSAPEATFTLVGPDGGPSVMTRPAEIRNSDLPGVSQATATFHAADLPPGEYLLRAEIRAGEAAASLSRHVRLYTGSGSPPSAAARSAEADAVARVAGAYVEAYLQRLSTVVMEETYVQQSRNGRQLQGRTLRSDVLMVRAEGAAPMGFRDVFEVDGRTIRDRDERLRRLFIEQRRDSAIEQARMIAMESARHNLGSALRTLNLPAMPLQFLLPGHQPRMSFELKGGRTVDGRRVVRLAFRETGSPSVVRTPGGDDVPATGEFWVDPDSGAVLRADTNIELWLDRRYRAPTLVGEIVVTFAPNEATGILMPDRMTERYVLGSGERNDCTARYSNFRLFLVRTEERVPPSD